MNSDPEEVNPDIEVQSDASPSMPDAEKPDIDLYARTILSTQPSDLEAMRERAGDLLAQIMEERP